MARDGDEQTATPKVPVIRSERGDVTPAKPTVPAKRAVPVAPTSELPSLPRGRRIGLAGGGALLVVGVLVGHVAAPIAVPAILVGGVLFGVGLGFERGLKSLRVSKDGVSAQADDAKTALAIVGDAAELSRRQVRRVAAWTEKLEKTLTFIAERRLSSQDESVAIADFVRSRLADLTQEFRKPGETMRASIWLQRADLRLHFVLGSDIENTGRTFAPGDGIIGRAFAQDEVWNVPNGPGRPEYVRDSGDAAEPFRGLLCVPLTKGAAPIGVLCVDRTSEEIFAPPAEEIARALGSIIVLALTTAQNPPR